MIIQEQSGVHVLHPEGDLTIFEAVEFREALLSLLTHEGPLELDVSEVERVDSSGYSADDRRVPRWQAGYYGYAWQCIRKNHEYWMCEFTPKGGW